MKKKKIRAIQDKMLMKKTSCFWKKPFNLVKIRVKLEMLFKAIKNLPI